MRSVSRNLFRILNNEEFRPVMFMEVRLPGGDDNSVIRLTDAGVTVYHAGYGYIPINIGRGAVEELLATDTGNFPGVTLAVSNIDTRMAALINKAEIEGARAKVWATDRTLLDAENNVAERDAFMITRGELRDVSINEQTLTFSILNVVGLMERVVIPKRIYQDGCNYAFGSEACGANLVEHQIHATPVLGTNDSLVKFGVGVLDAPAGGDNDYWANGVVIAVDGPAALQARPIQRWDGTDLYLRYPFLVNPYPCEMVVRRGCRKTIPDCTDRRGSLGKWHGGFPAVPYGRITPTIVTRPDTH